MTDWRWVSWWMKWLMPQQQIIDWLTVSQLMDEMIDASTTDYWLIDSESVDGWNDWCLNCRSLTDWRWVSWWMKWLIPNIRLLTDWRWVSWCIKWLMNQHQIIEWLTVSQLMQEMIDASTSDYWLIDGESVDGWNDWCLNISSFLLFWNINWYEITIFRCDIRVG